MKLFKRAGTVLDNRRGKHTHIEADGIAMWNTLPYILSSFFSGLVFAIVALIAKKKGKIYIWKLLLSIICIILFSILSYSLVYTSSPKKDAFYFYLGLSSLISNVIAVFVLIRTFLVKVE